MNAERGPGRPLHEDPRETSRFTELFQHYVEELQDRGFIDPDAIVEAHPDIGLALLEDLETYIQLRPLGEEEVSASPLGILGDYTLRRQIGRGGMGVVYEAWENSMDRRVALKVLPAGIAADDKAFSRFMREARTAGKLSHPNVVPVFGVGIKENTPYFAMEFVEGETLAQVLAKVKETDPDGDTVFGGKDHVGYFASIASAFAEVADGLQHAHAKRVIHRDIKPSNLILDGEGHLRILDFGLARLEGQESLTLSGDFLGTPRYMSPEQARRKKIPVDHRTDVYSLGATMYEALCGRPPFRGKDHADTLSQIIEREPVEPRKINPRVPKDLETIVLKCLRKEAGERYGTAEALGQDLRRFVRGEVIEAKAQARWERLTRNVWRRRRRLCALAAALGFFLLLGFFFWERSLEFERRKLELYVQKVEHAVLKTQLSQISIQSVFEPIMGAFNPSPGSVEDLNVEGFSGFLDPLEQARIELDEAIVLIPSLPHAYYHRARLSFIREGREGALRDLERALSRDPEHPASQVFRAVLQEDLTETGEKVDLAPHVPAGDVKTVLLDANLSMARKKWMEALQAFGRLELLDDSREASSDELYPGHRLEARLGKGVAAFEAGDYLRALMAFSEVEALWPEFLEIDLARAKTLFLYGEEGLAESLFEGVHERSPARGETAYEVMLFYGRRNRPEKALEWAGFLVREDVRERYRAYYLCVLQRWADAVAAATKSIRLNGQNFHAHADLAWALEAMGEIDRGAVHYQEALRIGHGFSYPHLAMAWSRLARGDPEGAVEELRVASGIDPANVQIRIDLGRHLTDIGEIEESKRILEEVLETEPNSIWALGNLGRTLVKENDYETAIRVARRGLEIDPQNGWLHNQIGWNLRDLGRLEEAKSHLRKAIEIAPPNVLRFSYVNLGRLFLDFDGNSSEAIEVLKEGVRVFPRDAPLLELLGEAYLREGDVRGALTSFRGAVETGIDLNFITPHAELAALLERPDLPELGEEIEHLCATLEQALARPQIHPALPLVLGSFVPRLVADPEQRSRILRPGLEEFGDFLTDSILDSVSSFPGREGDLLDMFRRLHESPRHAVYLEGRLLAKAGRHREASDRFLQILDAGALEPAPLLRLAECERALGEAANAEEHLREAPASGTRYERDLMELWAVLCLLDLDQSPAELLRKYPWASVGYAGDISWLLEQLVAGEAIRINCGAKEYLDPGGRLWSGDRFFVGGTPGGYVGGEIDRTESDPLYRSHRWFADHPSSRAAYRIPLPPGKYGVTLHFAETFFRLPERRVFDIWIDHRPVLEMYEPFALGFATAQVEEFSVDVEEGLLEIRFVGRVNHPMVSAIEVEKIN